MMLLRAIALLRVLRSHRHDEEQAAAGGWHPCTIIPPSAHVCRDRRAIAMAERHG